MPTNAELVTEIVAEIVREASEPLSVAQIVECAVARKAFASKNPKSAVRAALSFNDKVVSVGRNQYVYVPRLLTGSSFRIPLDLASRVINPPSLAVTAEADPCLWHVGERSVYDRDLLFQHPNMEEDDEEWDDDEDEEADDGQ